MQRGVHCRLMDNSTSVREAAVELLGRFVLSRPQLIEQYYDMLIERILVTFSFSLNRNLACICIKDIFHKKYYKCVSSPNLCARVFFWQDTGISVRKRVIKILRDICLEQPDFHRITEMCVKMIRRVNDEEGIKVCLSFFFSFFFLSSDGRRLLLVLKN